MESRISHVYCYDLFLLLFGELLFVYDDALPFDKDIII